MRPCSAHRPPPSASETDRLVQIADVLLPLADHDGEGADEPPTAVGVADEGDTVVFHLLDLHGTDPIETLTGFTAPGTWWAFGVCGPARVRSIDPAVPVPDGGSRRFVHLVTRSGLSVTALATHGERRAVPRPTREPAEGRLPDVCRRVLGLPTPPPEHDSGELFTTWWLDAVVGLVAETDGGPPSWSRIVDRHPSAAAVRAVDPVLGAELDEHVVELGNATRRAWPWHRLRRVCAEGGLSIEGVSADDARWMDDGCFARRALEPYPSTAELLEVLDALLPPQLAGRLRRIVGSWGLGGG